MDSAPSIPDAVRAVFPFALPLADVLATALAHLASEHGLAPERIAYAESLCADDIVAHQAPGPLGMIGPFRLGGLDGLPFAGATGMAAFASHVPDGGGAFLLHGPHLGIGHDGTLGAIRRPGQTAPTPTCGAASLALARLDRDGPPPSWELDPQQHELERILRDARHRIQGAGAPLREATEIVYETIQRWIDHLVQRTQFPGPVVIAGGILLHGDGDAPAGWEPRRLLCLDPATGETRPIPGGREAS